MKHYPCITATLATATACLLGLFAISIRAAAQPAPAHQSTHAKPASEKAAAGAKVPAMEDRVEAETQSPPGIVGKNWPEPVEDSQWFGFLLFDQLEYRMKNGADDTVRWDVQGWYGGDYNRLWLKTEGEWRTSGERGGEAEVQALYSRLIAPFWDFQIGVRYDLYSGVDFDRSRNDGGMDVRGPDDQYAGVGVDQSRNDGGMDVRGPDDQYSSVRFDRSRGFAVIGLQGLAPYRFELELALFISQDADVSARLAATYDILLTQRLILQPRLDFDAALQSVEKFGVGEGVNSIGLGLRLRYEIRREFAPYIGVHWLSRFGETADFARRDGEPADDFAVAFGIRLRL